MNGVHLWELCIEGIKGQQPSSDAHIVAITGECRTHDQHDGRSEKGIAPEAQVGFDGHDGGWTTKQQGS